MAETPSLDFAKPDYGYDERVEQLRSYEPDPERFPHDLASMTCVEQGIRAGRVGNVAVGRCVFKDGEEILRDMTQAVAPYHCTGLLAEMVLLNSLEDRMCDDPTPRMRDCTLFTGQEEQAGVAQLHRSGRRAVSRALLTPH